MDVVADIALLADERRPRVDADADTDWPVAYQVLREVRGGSECAWRCGERDKEGVSLRVDLDPPVAGTCLAYQCSVRGEGVRVSLCAEFCQQRR